MRGKGTPRELTGWGLAFTAAAVAAMLIAMMLWALHFLDSSPVPAEAVAVLLTPITA